MGLLWSASILVAQSASAIVNAGRSVCTNLKMLTLGSLDFFLAFFVNCSRCGDWLINSDSISERRWTA